MFSINIRVSLYAALLASIRLLPTAMAVITTIPSSSNTHLLVPDPMNPGQTKQADHDVYFRTKCYCRRYTDAPPETHWEGVYFHVEYFNHRIQRQFSLKWICKSNKLSGEFHDTECSPEQDEANFWRPSKFQYQGCASAGGNEEENDKQDEWCYDAQRQFQHHDMSKLNGQKRKLKLYGKELLESQDAVNQECHSICREKVEPGLGFLVYIQNPHEPIADNTIDIYDDVEDM